MKINGRRPSLSLEVVVIPRKDGDLVFKARGVMNDDYEQFEKLCKEPEAPWSQKKGEEPIRDVKDKDYLMSLAKFSSAKYDYMVITSLSATEGLEWDTVKLEDWQTWGNYREDLKKVLTNPEYNRVIDIVMCANGLDAKKIEAATKRFMSPEPPQQASPASSPTAEPVTTTSGSRANG